MTPDFTLIWPLSCLKDGVHLCMSISLRGNIRKCASQQMGWSYGRKIKRKRTLLRC